MGIPKKGTSRHAEGPSFFAIFPILWKLLLGYGRRLLSLDTLVSLEKKQGPGSGERSLEEDLLDRALECNKHHYHISDAKRVQQSQLIGGEDLAQPVLHVRKESAVEHRR